jgi:hypothetical protein
MWRLNIIQISPDSNNVIRAGDEIEPHAQAHIQFPVKCDLCDYYFASYLELCEHKKKSHKQVARAWKQPEVFSTVQ